MAVRIIFKDKKAPVAAPVEQPADKPKKKGVSFGKAKGSDAVVEAPAVKVIDGFSITPLIDLTTEKNVSKFLIHRHKKDIWYRVIAYDEYQTPHNLKLESPYGAVFDSTLKITDVKFYMMATCKDSEAKPTLKVLDYVRSFSK